MALASRLGGSHSRIRWLYAAGILSRTWKKIRDAYVASHPLCELCLKHGRYVMAEEVHHKKPLAEGGTHAWNNLIALCKACHARIHAKRGDRWHKKVEF